MNSCYLCHLHYVFSLLSQTHSAFLYLYLFWRANQMSKNRGRDDSWSFLVFNEYFPMVWISLFARSARRTTKRPAEKR